MDLFNIENKKQKVLEKIENKDFSFNDEELFLLSAFSDIKEKFLANISNDYSQMSTELIEIVSNILDEEDLYLLSDTFYYYLALDEIEKGNLSILSDIINFISDEVFERLKELISAKLDNPSYQANVYQLPIEILPIIFEKKRYQLLMDAKSLSGNIDNDETYNFIIEQCINQFRKIPKYLIDSINVDDIDLSKIDIETLLLLAEKGNLSNDVAFDFIIEELNNEETLVDNSYYISSLTVSKTDTKKMELFDLLLKKNYIGSMLNSIPSIENDLDKYIPKIINAINNGAIISSRLTYDDQKNIDFILENEEVMRSLIETGQIDIAAKSPLFNNYKDEVIINIKTIKDYYKRISGNNEIKEYKEILIALAENDYSFAYEMLDSDTLNEIVVKKIRSGQLLKSSTINIKDSKILEEIIISRNSTQLFSLSIYDEVNISEEAINVVIDESINNLAYAHKFISYFPKVVCCNNTLCSFFLSANGIFIEKILNQVNHDENLSYFYNSDNYNLLKQYFIEKYGLNFNDIEHLDILEQRFGPLIIRYMDNPNIQNIIKLQNDHFDKFMRLFPDTIFTMADADKTYDSLKQYEFSKKHPEIVEIFANINHSLSYNNQEYIKLLEEILTVLDDKFYSKFFKKYPELADEYETDFVGLLKTIIFNIQNNNAEYLEILHTITDYYISTKREEYRSTYNMSGELNLPYNYDERDLKRVATKYCLENSQHRDIIIKKLIETGMDEGLVLKCISYYLGKRDSLNEEEKKLIQKSIRDMMPIITEYVKYICEKDNMIGILNNYEEIKKQYYVESNQDIYQILMGIRIDSLEKNLFPVEFDKIYQSLVRTMEKTKLHLLPNNFKQLLESDYIDIDSDYTNLVGFISFYHKIYEMEKSRLEALQKNTDNIQLSIANIFINAEVFSSVSNVYSQILGVKDARLVKSNPGPNAATSKSTGDARLKEAVNWTINNFRRMEVTVPSFSVLLSSDSEEKTLKATVGNFTHPSNITHGERTGACMRIGGVGDSLFEFCLENKNGFHIVFNDSITDEYISRVSGFRNGNTVFLNELRHSCNTDKYDDSDIIRACKETARLLIDKSKDSDCPIENVVIANAYAMVSSNEETVRLNITDNKKGFKNFYSDVGSIVIVLATSSPDSKFSSVNLNNENVPSYLPVREKGIESDNYGNMEGKMNRIHAIKEILSGTSWDMVEPIELSQDFLYGIAGQDWYIWVDQKGFINEECIDIDKRAKEELDIARKKIADYISSKGINIEPTQVYNK